jgi:hypothetical protein
VPTRKVVSRSRMEAFFMWVTFLSRRARGADLN